MLSISFGKKIFKHIFTFACYFQEENMTVNCNSCNQLGFVSRDTRFYNGLITGGNEILIRWNELVILRERAIYLEGTN